MPSYKELTVLYLRKLNIHLQILKLYNRRQIYYANETVPRNNMLNEPHLI